jgi:hypothetical protein
MLVAPERKQIVQRLVESKRAVAAKSYQPCGSGSVKLRSRKRAMRMRVAASVRIHCHTGPGLPKVGMRDILDEMQHKIIAGGADTP